jgi:hypothetical protein
METTVAIRKLSRCEAAGVLTIPSWAARPDQVQLDRSGATWNLIGSVVASESWDS